MVLTCKICGDSEPTVEFYSGVNCRCKECHKLMVRTNRRDRFEQYKEYEKMRYKRDAYRKEKSIEYAKTERGKAAHAKAIKRRNELSPEKKAANTILGNAVRDGRIIKPLSCEKCGDVPPRSRLHGHHSDYTKPLDVEWLCSKCHAIEHYGVAPEPQLKNRSRGRHV